MTIKMVMICDGCAAEIEDVDAAYHLECPLESGEDALGEYEKVPKYDFCCTGCMMDWINKQAIDYYQGKQESVK